MLNQYLKKIFWVPGDHFEGLFWTILGFRGSFWRLILNESGFRGIILEAKSVFKRRLWANRVSYATSSGPKWPQVRRNHPQGRPKGAKKEPQEDPKWNKNRSKTLYKIKNMKTSKMTTLPHEIHIFEGSKGGKIDRKALQIVFLGSSNGCS